MSRAFNFIGLFLVGTCASLIPCILLKDIVTDFARGLICGIVMFIAMYEYNKEIL
jgi:hypothetical protein